MVDELFLWRWDGADESIWKQLPELERRHTPLSDHLCDVMEGWRTSFAAVVADYEELYDTWEILGALSYCEILPMEELQDESHHFWAPLGRNAWRHESRERVLERVLGGDMFDALVAAGFGGGSAEKLAAIVRRYDGVARKLHWR